MAKTPWFVLAVALLATGAAAEVPATTEGDFILRDFRFASGESLPELKLHYVTMGRPQKDAAGVVRNAVLVLHGTGGSSRQFLTPTFAGELFGPGQILDASAQGTVDNERGEASPRRADDASRYFIVIPDGIGHGRSSKPSDGLRMRFPRYTYDDMVSAQHRLLTEGLGVHHLALVIGTSMGGMHAWVWAERHPQFMDALVPLAAVPTAIAGRNRVMRRMISDAIRGDPTWKGGDYTEPPKQGLTAAVDILLMMGSSPLQWHKAAPTRDAADAFLTEQRTRRLATADANDMLYAFDASRDYDPSPRLENVRARVLAINSADDVVNPPELGLMEPLIARVPHARYVLLPISAATRGHGTHSLPTLWKPYLAAFLAEREGKAAAATPHEAEELKTLEHRLVTAIGARDLETYDTVVADDYVVVEAAGTLRTKTDVMASYRGGERGYRDLKIDEVKAHVFGDTAVVHARTSGVRIVAGKEELNRVRYVRVYTRREGRWQAVTQMATPLP
jgi:homoserine O-acetyltransferase/O-succinyltransferase